jgi:hypothetical protein
LALEAARAVDAYLEEVASMRRLAECAARQAEPGVALHWLHQADKRSKDCNCHVFSKEVRAIAVNIEALCWAAERVLWIGCQSGQLGGISPDAIRLLSVYAGLRAPCATPQRIYF